VESSKIKIASIEQTAGKLYPNQVLMKKLTDFLKKINSTPELKKKLLFTAAILLAFRFFAHIPLPSVDLQQLRQLFASNQFLSLLNVFSGGTLSNFSVLAVGINPYITASIVMQLGGMVVPKIKEMQKDGEAGREKLNQYTRYLSVPLAVGQSISVLALLRSQNLLESTSPLAFIALILSLVAGSLIVTWLGELVSLHGIGNGISMILFAGIVSQLPSSFSQVLLSGTNRLFVGVSFFTVFFMIIGLIVFMNEAVRKITIQYATRTRGKKSYGGQTTHLPIKVNVAGVMPIIFAVSIMLVPSFVAKLMIASSNPKIIEIGNMLTINFQQTSPVYMILYFIIVFFFTFFSSMIFFNAEDISDELKKSGAFVPGIRPGTNTKKFLEYVVSRITIAGAFFLGFIAIMPSLAQIFTGIGQLSVSGTSILIVVSVVLETYKQVDSMLVEQNYDRFI